MRHPASNARVDVSTERCPMTWVRTKVALSKVAPGDLLEVVLGPGEMQVNVPRNLVDDGHAIESTTDDGDRRILVVRRKT